MSKLCYILPEYREGDATHFAYLGDFIKEISKNFDIFLVVEKGSVPLADWGYKKARKLFFNFAPLRIIELFFVVLFVRMGEYKDFYVHYSFVGAKVAAIVTGIFGGRVFYWNCGEPWKYKRNFLRENFERAVYGNVTYLVTGTDTSARAYSEYYKIPMGKIKVMPNWIVSQIANRKSQIAKAEIKSELKIKENQKILLFVHRLSKRKGAQYLPAILDGLRGKDVVMLIAGEGPERGDLEESFRVLGLTDRVRFLGAVPQSDIASYYGVADVFVMPSDEEGFPHVLLEAMAAGTPFVATNVGAVRDIVPDLAQNYVVASGDVAAIVEAVSVILGMPGEERARMGDELRQFVGRYDISKAVGIFEQMLK